MFGIPNFNRRRQRLEPVRFVPVSQVFEPQVKVQALRDLNGWADRDRRVKWTINRGRVGFLSADIAREFEVKGYVRIVEGEVEPVSEDEAAEMLSNMTTVTLGAG